MELRRSVMVAPKFLALAILVRSGAAQRPVGQEFLFIHRGLPRCEMWKAKNAPVAEVVDARDSKSLPTGCWFDSSRGYKVL